jgi:hypothetical protein
MLTDQLRHVRRSPALALIVLAGGLMLGVLIGVIFGDSGGSAHAVRRVGLTATVAVGPARADSRLAASAGGGASSGRAATLPPASAGSNDPVGANGSQAYPGDRETLATELSQGVAAADALGGVAAAAIWVHGDAQPVLVGPTMQRYRMWSVSKAVATIATLQATNDHPDSVLRSAMADAIRRSDNCAIRRVIVGLQDRLGAGNRGTVAAFEHVLAIAGAGIERAPQSAAAEQACVRYLDRHQSGLPGSDLGIVPEFGTAEWTEKDAIFFAHALSEGLYGASGAYLLALMGQPKEPPLEEPPPPAAPPLGWGAGAAFPSSWKPAWKAGWGGSQNDPPHFLASQIVVLHLGRVPVAVTAVFVPRAEPATDNPGITHAPEALELMFRAARAGLERKRVGGIG